MKTDRRKTDRRGLRDWFIITVIILIGFLCLIVAGSMAVRFAPRWQLSSNMNSHLDPNSDYLTNRPRGYIEPVDQSILTPPIWIDFFQTPGASVPQRTPLPTQTAAPAITAFVIPTNTIPPAATLNPTNTIVYIPAPPTNTQRPAPPATNTATATATATNVTSVDADLMVTKDDGVLIYSAGMTLKYTIFVTNNGPADVYGAVVTDKIPVLFDDWGWKCVSMNSGATGCDPTGSNTSNFSDIVDLPSGASIEYQITAHVSASASGDLVNIAEVAVPATNTETNPSNNLASDTDQFLPTATLPTSNIGDSQDGKIDVVPPGNSITIMFSTPLVVNGHAGYDLVYYELQNGGGIMMDIVALEIGDGNYWHRIFFWGDNAADTNSTMNFSVLGETPADKPEIDNRDFTSPPPGLLYNGTGIAIELDGIVPPGTYPYVRFISPPAPGFCDCINTDGGIEVDAIVILP